MMKAIAAAGGPGDFVYDRDAFMLRRDGAIANLSNIYVQYQNVRGAHRRRVFDNFVAAMAPGQPEITSADIDTKLTAVIRERAFLAAMEGPGWGLDGAAEPARWPVHEPITAWFSKALVIDYPTHVAVVNQSHLTDWSLTFDEAYKIGFEKLRGCTAPKFQQAGGYFVSGWNDDYDSSRLLLPGIFDDLPLDGDPVVTIPNRLTLMVTGSNDHAGIGAMLVKAEDLARTQAKPQHIGPLLVHGDQISEFHPDRSSPAYTAVARAHRVGALMTYEDQKANLDLAYKKIGKDVFVASYKLFQTDRGDYESVSVWSRDVATLLPVTDFVMFIDPALPDGQHLAAKASWAQVTATCGDLMLDTKMFPPRHYVSKFPDAAQLRALTAGE